MELIKYNNLRKISIEAKLKERYEAEQIRLNEENSFENSYFEKIQSNALEEDTTENKIGISSQVGIVYQRDNNNSATSDNDDATNRHVEENNNKNKSSHDQKSTVQLTESETNISYVNAEELRSSRNSIEDDNDSFISKLKDMEEMKKKNLESKKKKQVEDEIRLQKESEELESKRNKSMLIF